jgi:hypothetical protein
MFLRRSAVLLIYGVEDPTKQDQLLKAIAGYKRRQGAEPIRVEFYEQENWIPFAYDREGKVLGRKRGPERLLRIAVIP